MYVTSALDLWACPADGRAVCPHVSFDNPNASKDAERRSSVETRSIVITKI